MLCAKFCWNRPTGYGEKRFLNLGKLILLFRNYLPLEKVVALYVNKLESPEDALWKAWLKLAHWFLRKRFLNCVNISLLFRSYLHWKRAWPFIWPNMNPLHPRLLCAKFGWNWHSGSREEYENLKSIIDGRTTDDRRSETLNWVFN